jgi:Txe/YoeB family toxin of Txe-Axe toxin-antitoxin module
VNSSYRVATTPRFDSEMKEWRSHHHRNKIHKRIHILINDILASPFKGIGKPEPLKNQNGV